MHLRAYPHNAKLPRALRNHEWYGKNLFLNGKAFSKMDNNEKKRLIKIIILLIIQSSVIIGIIHCAEIQGFPQIVCWGAKAGAIFFLIVASILLIKEIIKLLS